MAGLTLFPVGFSKNFCFIYSIKVEIFFTVKNFIRYYYGPIRQRHEKIFIINKNLRSKSLTNPDKMAKKNKIINNLFYVINVITHFSIF